MSQSIVSLIEHCEACGVHLYEEAGALRYYSEQPELPEHIREAARREKTRLLDHLAQPDPLASELSGLRQAYWLGEHSAFSEGGAAYLHLVYAGDIPRQETLQEALRRLVLLHPILGYTLDAEVPRFKLMQVGPGVVERVQAHAGHPPRSCAALGEGLPVAALSAGRALVRLVLVEGQGQRCLHVVYRLALFDAPSVQIFINDLAALLRDPEYRPHVSAGYRSEVVAERVRVQRLARFKARHYWRERIATLAAGPDLPRSCRRSPTVRPGRFIEHRMPLQAAQVQALRAQARAHHVSLNAVLLTAYLQTLARWSGVASVTSSVMYSNRAALGQAVQRCLGNHSDTVLIDLPATQLPFGERVRLLQQDLHAAMQHGAYDGTSAVREWIRRHDTRSSSAEPPMPYVFSSLLDMQLAPPAFEQVDHAMMTPQIWIDAQAFEQDSVLWLTWDEREGVFEQGVIAEAFQAYCDHLLYLATDSAAWGDVEMRLPAVLQERLLAFNRTERVFAPMTLWEGLLHQARECPDAPAVIDAQGSLGFAQLLRQASLLACHLNENGVGPSDHVVIRGSHDVANVVAIYATLMAGATYVPVSKRSPVQRVRAMISQAAATTVLGDDDDDIAAILASPVNWSLNYRSWLRGDEAQGDFIAPTYPAVNSSVAYIMFTSGTTGTPKGVSITHHAAVNTLQDCQARWDIGRGDRLFGVSEFSFDLSVFDLFMPALSGCALVLAQEGREADPQGWVALAREHRVTVWNSVPAIMEMLLDYAQAMALGAPAPSVRLWMASGDWIGLGLPGRLRQCAPQSRFIALGGATEAAIWSNSFEVHAVDPAWPSIPYGRPLANQRFYILDALGRCCPPAVKGMLFIAGQGLATGYVQDQPRTDQVFTQHSGLGQRLYRTGDLGRLRMDGEMELLGREDLQVKRNGFRIELAEIEAVFCRADGVRQAVACLDPNGGLTLFVVSEHGSAVDTQALRHFAGQYLNDYMLPSRMVQLAQLPLTANGKLDRKSLAGLAAQAADAVETDPSFCPQQELALQCVRQVLPAVRDAQSSWFELGATSLHAVRILQALNTQLGMQLSLADLYAHPSVSALLGHLQAVVGRSRNLVRFSHDNQRALLVLVHPVGGALSCYLPLVESLRGVFDIAGVCADAEQHFASIEEQAREYVRQLCPLIVDCRPVVLAGWSFGGVVAAEMARQMIGMPEVSQRLAVVTIDAGARGGDVAAFPPDLLQQLFQQDLQQTRQWLLAPEEDDTLVGRVLEERFTLFCRHYAALLAYRYVPVDCYTWHLRASAQNRSSGLQPLAQLNPQAGCTTIDADHYGMLGGAAMHVVITTLRQALEVIAPSSREELTV
ncbi:amino acid adenylation enzyme/thioester reductase family protein [Pseudomonas asplenii]|uniref:Amino acid adenylation enzyme/thioester reductase family protein n=2 Tax=Pseudomonas asplenii TaxID=53407 RepID=A0A0N0E571_9PSED|nr:non-ribosomal peptide synthetase [Pseudomonas fuscovaginae]KPA92127.1 amino acid adenylation enzyme/thioester reductase family protein [Pseudomonas fuscovaginae]